MIKTVSVYFCNDRKFHNEGCERDRLIIAPNGYSLICGQCGRCLPAEQYMAEEPETLEEWRELKEKLENGRA